MSALNKVLFMIAQLGAAVIAYVNTYMKQNIVC